jgi:hypothetical protein
MSPKVTSMFLSLDICKESPRHKKNLGSNKLNQISYAPLNNKYIICYLNMENITWTIQ